MYNFIDYQIVYRTILESEAAQLLHHKPHGGLAVDLHQVRVDALAVGLGLGVPHLREVVQTQAAEMNLVCINPVIVTFHSLMVLNLNPDCCCRSY